MPSPVITFQTLIIALNTDSERDNVKLARTGRGELTQYKRVLDIQISKKIYVDPRPLDILSKRTWTLMFSEMLLSL